MSIPDILPKEILHSVQLSRILQAMYHMMEVKRLIIFCVCVV